ncbi:MAG TPA: SBBP repeat-containing protein, partial [Acidobacteriota bacterium]
MVKKVIAGAVSIACLSILTAWTHMPGASAPIPFSSLAPAGRILLAQADFGKLPVNFIPNGGQWDKDVDYAVQGRDKTIWFGAGGITLALNQGAEGRRWVVKLDFVGAHPGLRPVGLEETGTVISYFKGQPGNWRTGLAACSRLLYTDLWPGIDLAFAGTMDKLKYEFIVRPGADPSRIRLACRGASSVFVDDRGSLVVTTPSGSFEDGRPVAYQEQAGKRTEVKLDYRILNHLPSGTDSGGPGSMAGKDVLYGFSVGAYDRTKPLVLDPVILVYCGYLGGASYDYGYGLAADSSGHAYLTGTTYSGGAVFPTAVGPDKTFNGGNADAFVAKLNPSGTALEYCGYIGGAGDDYGYGLAVDSSGNAFVTGYTSSTEATFPVRRGPDLTHNGLFDAFVAKVSADGTALDYCGYIGGAGDDSGSGIAVDLSGSAYLTGSTTSKEDTFSIIFGPTLTFNGESDAFVAKVDYQGEFFYCGYIGGSGQDYGNAIAVDLSGNAYVTGHTNSTESTFTVWSGPDTTFNGEVDAFLVKVSALGSAMLYSGYIGGSGYDSGTGIAVDSLGFAYVTGYTSSKEDTFPVTEGPDLTSHGSFDAFVAKV